MKKKVFHKSMAVALATAMTATGFAPLAASTVHAQGTAVEQAQTNGTVDMKKNGTEYVFGNGYLKRTFDVSADKVLTTKSITNYRTDKTATVFSPKSGSEEFVINTMENGNAQAGGFVAPTGKLDTTGWVATEDSKASGEGTNGPAQMMFDGKDDTYYHSDYGAVGSNPTEDVKKYPHNVYVDFGTSKTFQSLRYQQRVDASGNPTPSGHVKGYKIYVGATEQEVKDPNAKPVLQGEFKDEKETYVNFDTVQNAQWVRIEFLNCHTPSQGGISTHVACCSELDFFEGTATFPEKTATQVKSSEMKVVGEPEFKNANGVKTLTFTFEPKVVRGVSYTVKEIISMKDGDSFMRKHLEISVPDGQEDLAKIDYVDLENMMIPSEDLKAKEFWTISDNMANNPDMGGMKGDYLELGQPYYLAAMYWGCEFPQTENKIIGDRAFVRYHYGKSLKVDDKFSYNEGNQKGKMTTWDAVVGAARSRDYSVVQSDFYEYIETIATKTDFRQQYNSWYDNMKNITDASIQKSFFEVEKGFTQKGIEPLDSYVVDDGWIDYHNSFWGFNNKFPNELYNSSMQVQNMGANFGLWLGPRGGYSTQTAIANYIANHNWGSVNHQSGNDINVSDARYLTKLTNDIFCNYQDKFDINYWKLDGMLLEPSRDKSDYYVTGNPLYTISETYERWTDVFEDMRENRKGKDLWLNLTSYVNPSPWHLQWVNSVWMQNSGDTGYTNKFGATTEQQMLTYRDNCYYNFLNDRQWQLPNKYFYNHDPVYGVSATDCPSYPGKKGDIISYTTDEMRNHLYMLGTRGTAFWEYYYSPSMFDDDKWQVNAEAAKWIEGNFDILQKSKMFGGRPENGDVYGFSCWNGKQGIVSIRNPKNVEQTYTLKHDRLVGVSEDLGTVYGKVVLGDQKWQTNEPMTYGKEVTYTLKPQEVLIIQYGAKDEKAPAILSVKGTDAGVEVEFDETIQAPKAADFSIPGYTVNDATLKADRRTVKLTLDKATKDGQVLNVAVNGVKDIPGNVVNSSKSNDVFKDGIVTGIKDQKGLNGSKAFTTAATRSIDGKGGFSVTGKLTTTAKNVDVASQNGAYKVAIDAEGYLTFEFNGMKISSKNEVRTVSKTETKGYTSKTEGIIADGKEHQFSAVKEVNGMIKIYLDGKVVASKYDVTKVNPEIQKAETVFANKLTGDVAYITVTDYSLPYDQVSSLNGIANQNVVLSSNNPKVKVTAWNVTKNEAVPFKSDRPASHVNDGNKNYQSNYLELNDTASKQNESRYIQFDLGEEYELDKIHMWRYADGRTYGPTAVVLSNDENFAEANRTVVYNSDKEGNVHNLGKGTHDTYSETQQGKELWKTDKPVKARYIRLYVNGRANNQGTSDHIVEFEAYGKRAGASIVLPDMVLDSVAITSPAPAEMKVGDTHQAVAECYPAGLENVSLEWKSDNPTIASVNKDTGLVTALKAGTATITVTAKQKNGADTITKTATMTVTVKKETTPQPQPEKPQDFQVSITINGVTVTQNANSNMSLKDLKLEVPEKVGYTFVGWNTKADGSGKKLTADSVLTAGMEIHAVFTKNEEQKPDPQPETPQKFQVSVVVDGVTTKHDADSNMSLKDLKLEVPEKAGYTFAGWNTKADGTGEKLTADSALTADMAIYAVFTKNEEPAPKPEPKPEKPVQKPAQKPNTDKAPTTGDAATAVLPALLLATAGAAVVVLGKKKEEN